MWCKRRLTASGLGWLGVAKAGNLTGTEAWLGDERDVVVTSVEDRPGTGGELLRRVADAGANVDLLYLTMDGRLVLSGGDVSAIQRALT